VAGRPTEAAVNEVVKLRIIRGGLHPAARRPGGLFSSAFATNTRLMGVIAMYIHWVGAPAGPESDLHQFFYIDAERYGIENYQSVEGNNAESLYETEQSLMSGLGGSKIDLTESEAIFIVQKYARMANDRGSGPPSGKEEFAFILEKPCSLAPIEEDVLFRKLCVTLENDEHAINYFLMRYFSKDAEAVKMLTTRPNSIGAAFGGRGETLCKNTIEAYINPSGPSYLCESLIENNNRYRLVLSEIYMNAKLVSSFRIRSCFHVSASEAAMMLCRPEYITVYETLEEAKDIQKSIMRLYPGALHKERDEGRLYIHFKNNNEHLKESAYRLNDDVRGMFFVTTHGQFIAVAYSLRTINRIEKELRAGMRSSLSLRDKYEFKDSVFYEFMQGDFLDFTDFVDYLSEFEPGD
jgi:hypothetical protein